MRRLHLLILLNAVVLATALAHAEAPVETASRAQVATFDDGPYLRRTASGIEARWICNGQPIERTIPDTGDGTLIAPECGYDRPIRLQTATTAPSTLPPGITRLVALSDVHGQHDLMIRLLQANGVIDSERDWSWGDGHLVMTGDLFDRGDRVTETLWLLYELEQQAKAAGGGLHFLIGNHEAMVLQGDPRYLHEKYPQTSALLGQNYAALHDADSIIGQWLRTRATILQAGDWLFLHGGIHDSYLALGLSLDQANQRFRESLGMSRDETKRDPVLAALYDGQWGPLWYRGYFLDPTLTQKHVESITNRLGVRHIAVGHTSMSEIASHFHGRVIAIDSSIKNGESGELLFIENGAMSRGTLSGQRISLPVD